MTTSVRIFATALAILTLGTMTGCPGRHHLLRSQTPVFTKIAPGAR